MTDFLVSFLLVRGGMVLTMFALFAFVSGAPDVGWVFVYLLIVLGLITGTEYTMGFWRSFGRQLEEDVRIMWDSIVGSLAEAKGSTKRKLLEPGVGLGILVLLVFVLFYVIAFVATITS